MPMVKKIANQIVEHQDNLYLLGADGKSRTDNAWVDIDGKHYFPNSQGKLYRNQWITFGPKRAHYMDNDGAALTGINKVGGNLHLFDERDLQRGVLRKDNAWVEYNNKHYFPNASGKLYHNQFITFGPEVAYFLNKDGQKVIENFTFDGHNFEVNDTGIVSKVQYKNYLEYNSEPMRLARTTLNNLGWDLRKAFEYSKNLTYYGNELRLPSIKDYALYGFRNLRGNCYVKASTFYYFARLMGLEVAQVAGYIGPNEHSWLEVIHDGETFVYDPIDANLDISSIYKIKYGQSGTLKYTITSYLQ